MLGFVFVVLAFFVNVFYSPELSETLPSWVYYFYAACIWIYGSFDAVDGKQARRTGTSSPLGEMFDHGCDSLAVTVSIMSNNNGINNTLMMLYRMFANVPNIIHCMNCVL